jgi:flagellar hook-associated protein 2
VTASILEYGSAYHLVLAGDDTGDDYDITIDDVQTTLVGYDTADFTESQNAADAQIRVDGFPASDWITRSSNTITDVLPGVRLTLKSTSAQAVNVSLTRSTSQLRVHLENLVAIFNSLVDTVGQYTDYDTDTSSRGLLQGDAGLNDIVSRLRLVLMQAVPGFQEGQDTYTLPANIGIEGVYDIEEQEGHLSLDTDVFADALAEDYEAVLSLIGAQGEGSSDDAGNYIQFISATDSTTAGIYEVQVFFNDQGDILSAGIREKGETGWNSDVNIDGSVISGKAGYPEQGLEITAIWDGVTLGDPQTAEISVRHGFADGLHDILDDVLDAVTGVIATRKERFADQIEAIDRNIELQQSRLETKQELLTSRYARLEATLARIDAQQAAIFGLLQSLGSTAAT